MRMEALYQYLWRHRLMGRRLSTVGGEEVRVIDPGVLNTDAGPDFFNAKVRIGAQQWAGNIEIHVKASDWYRHGHDRDPAYGNVILHVVGVSDREVFKSDGTRLPQAELTLPEGFFRTYRELHDGLLSVRCAPRLRELSVLNVADWLETLGVERMQTKAERILSVYRGCGCDWRQTCFVALARGLGFGLNSDPFEMLARSVDLKYAGRHSDNPFQLQALLFGQAGMLDPTRFIFDEYYQGMCREYFFLARKYGMRPMRPDLWKYARTRPQNFPHRRIALLARFLEGGFSLFSAIKDAGGDGDRLRPVFRMPLEGYWHDHSSFDVVSRFPSDVLSEASIDLLLINTVAPLYYAYGVVTGDAEAGSLGLDIQSRLPAERNTIVRHWEDLGLKAGDAFRSQALIQLRKEYCDRKKCLFCRFGHQLLRRDAAM